MKRLLTCCLLSLSLLSCSVKEDRGDCPCILRLDLGQCQDVATVMQLSIGRNELPIAQEIRPYDYQGRMYERSVTRGEWNIVCWSGLQYCKLSGERIVIPLGKGFDEIYTCHETVDCDGESVTHTVRLHKDYARVSVTPVSSSGLPANYELMLTAGTSAIRLTDGRPQEGDFAVALSADHAGLIEVAIPRQADGTSLCLRLMRESVTVGEVPIGEWLRQTGYDWWSPDLNDIRVFLDLEHMNATLVVEEWKEGQVFDIVI